MCAKQIEELEGSNSRLTEEVQTLKNEIESKETNEEELQERITELDSELSTCFTYLLSISAYQVTCLCDSDTTREMFNVMIDNYTTTTQMKFFLICYLIL